MAYAEGVMLPKAVQKGGKKEMFAVNCEASARSLLKVMFEDINEVLQLRKESSHVKISVGLLLGHQREDGVSKSQDRKINVQRLIQHTIPCHKVTLTKSTPPHITPLVKSLLRKRNKLSRKGRTEAANELSTKIGFSLQSFVLHIYSA